MRALVIGPTERARAVELAAFAARPENLYDPENDAAIPGDDERFLMRLGVFEEVRVVFSHTKLGGKIWKHMSVSIDPERLLAPALPNLAVVDQIATTLGFGEGRSIGTCSYADLGCPLPCLVVVEQL